jgi:hypothetical protein
VVLTEIQVDPWDNTFMYFTSNPGQIWSTNRGRVQIVRGDGLGEDWIAEGGRFVIRTTVSGGATAAFTAIYMTKRSISI